MKQANEQWKKVREQLRTCLRRAAELCLQRGQISESDYDEFFISSEFLFLSFQFPHLYDHVRL